MESFIIKEHLCGMRDELYGEVVRCSRLRLELNKTKVLAFYALITSPLVGFLVVCLIDNPLVVKVVLGGLAVIMFGSVVTLAKTFRVLSSAYYDLSGRCQRLLNSSLLQELAKSGARRPGQTSQPEKDEVKDHRFIWLH